MNCGRVRQRLASYWDMDERDPVRLEMDEHLARCPECRREWEIWRRCVEDVREFGFDEVPPVAFDGVDGSDGAMRRETEEAGGVGRQMGGGRSVSERVMARIYADEAWRMPLAWRPYAISPAWRRHAVALFAFFFGMFWFAFAYSLLAPRGPEPTPAEYAAILEVATASPETPDSASASFALVSAVLDPAKIRTGPVDVSTNYLLALSIWGIVFTLLVFHWFGKVGR